MNQQEMTRLLDVIGQIFGFLTWLFGILFWLYMFNYCYLNMFSRIDISSLVIVVNIIGSIV